MKGIRIVTSLETIILRYKQNYYVINGINKAYFILFGILNEFVLTTPISCFCNFLLPYSTVFITTG